MGSTRNNSISLTEQGVYRTQGNSMAFQFGKRNNSHQRSNFDTRKMNQQSSEFSDGSGEMDPSSYISQSGMRENQSIMNTTLNTFKPQGKQAMNNTMTLGFGHQSNLPKSIAMK